MAIYEYRAKCIRVVSGLTVELGVDLGFGLNLVRKFDLGVGLKESSKRVRARVEELLFDGLDDSGINADSTPKDLLIHTNQQTDDLYMAAVMIWYERDHQWTSISDILIEEGLAVL